MQILYMIISAVLGFVVGMVTTVLKSNHSSDTETRNDVLKIIDEVIATCHVRYTSEPDRRIAAAMSFDYHIKNLVDNTTLLPIIGRTCFDQSYSKQIEDLFLLTSKEPREIDQADVSDLLKQVNTIAVNLKKTVNLGKGSFRLLPKS